MEEETEEKSWISPIKIILALALILIIILMSVPYYNIKQNPEPNFIPEIEDVFTQVDISSQTIKVNSTTDFRLFVTPGNPQIKYTANKISTLACDGSIICQSKAIYYFVRDRLEYVADPINVEYVEPPMEVLASGGGDCESGSILLASLLEAIGVNTQLVFIQGHAYVRARINEAPNRYKHEDWIYLDWTCKECEFGEIPWQNWQKDATYLEVP